MTKEKKSANPKKSANSESSGSTLGKLFNDIKSKVVGEPVKEAAPKAKTPRAPKTQSTQVTTEATGQVVTETQPATQKAVVMKTNPSTLLSADPVQDEEVVLTDAEGRRYCRVTDCDQISTVDTYCRYHYLLHWKKIQVRKKILADGKLERYIDELTARYTDKFIELLRKDLRTEKDFMSAIQELELDGSTESGNDDDDDGKTYLDEVGSVGGDTSRDSDDF